MSKQTHIKSNGKMLLIFPNCDDDRIGLPTFALSQDSTKTSNLMLFHLPTNKTDNICKRFVLARMNGMSKTTGRNHRKTSSSSSFCLWTLKLSLKSTQTHTRQRKTKQVPTFRVNVHAWAWRVCSVQGSAVQCSNWNRTLGPGCVNSIPLSCWCVCVCVSWCAVEFQCSSAMSSALSHRLREFACNNTEPWALVLHPFGPWPVIVGHICCLCCSYILCIWYNWFGSIFHHHHLENGFWNEERESGNRKENYSSTQEHL